LSTSWQDGQTAPDINRALLAIVAPLVGLIFALHYSMPSCLSNAST
jgi:hypothetical protein